MSVYVSGRVWKTSRQNRNELLLLLAIADIADDDGVAWPGIERLAKKTRLTERTVYRLIGHLISAGELEVTPGGGRRKTNLYKVLYVQEEQPQQNPDRMSPFTDETLTPATGVEEINPDTSDNKPCHQRHETLTPVSLNPDTGVTQHFTIRHLYVKEPSARARPIRKKVKKLGDLEINDYFEWLIYNHAPHVDLKRALLEFVNYCQAEGPKIKDYAAAFENALLRLEEWWLEHPPAKGQASPVLLPSDLGRVGGNRVRRN